MNDELLIKTAVMVSLLGLSALFVMATFFPQTPADPTSPIKSVTGTVQRVHTSGDTSFVTISQQEELQLILFNHNDSSMFSEGDVIEAVGIVEENDETSNLIADNVRIIRQPKT